MEGWRTMKIDWKSRIKSYPFWVAFFSLIGLFVIDLGTIDVGTYEKYVDAILSLLIAAGIVNNPTTNGFSDGDK